MTRVMEAVGGVMREREGENRRKEERGGVRER
jgi:hypothetical protein